MPVELIFYSSAPFSFFQKVDVGLITNRQASIWQLMWKPMLSPYRFSQDIELIDMSLPVQAINTYIGR